MNYTKKNTNCSRKMRNREKILFDFMHSGDYRKCPNSTKLLNLEVLLDSRDLLVEIKDGLSTMNKFLTATKRLKL